MKTRRPKRESCESLIMVERKIREIDTKIDEATMERHVWYREYCDLIMDAYGLVPGVTRVTDTEVPGSVFIVCSVESHDVNQGPPTLRATRLKKNGKPYKSWDFVRHWEILEE